MSTPQHIGNDFSKRVKLNLIPGVSLPMGFYQIQLQYVTYDTVTHMTHYNNSSYMVDGRSIEIFVGADVRDITFTCQRLMTQGMPTGYHQYSLRVDRLILLNLAHQLLKSRLT